MARQRKKSRHSTKLSGHAIAKKPQESDVEHSGLSMTDAIKASAGRLPLGARQPRRQRPEVSLSQSVKKVASHKRNPPATRTGRKGIVIYFEQHVAAAIRHLASDCDTTNQELGEMAFKFLFEKFGEPWPA
jgi:hypothetical protein